MDELTESKLAQLFPSATFEIVRLWLPVLEAIECPSNFRCLRFVIHTLDISAQFEPELFSQTFGVPDDLINTMFSITSEPNTKQFVEYSNTTLAHGSKGDKPIYSLLFEFHRIIDAQLAEILLLFLDHYAQNETEITSRNKAEPTLSSLRLLYPDKKFTTSCLAGRNPEQIAKQLLHLKDELLSGDSHEENWNKNMRGRIWNLIHFYHVNWSDRHKRSRKSKHALRGSYRRNKPERLIGSDHLTTYSLKKLTFSEEYLNNGVSPFEDLPPLSVVNNEILETPRPAHEIPDLSVIRDGQKSKDKKRSINKSVTQSHNITALSRNVLQPHELTYLLNELFSTRGGHINGIDKNKLRCIALVCLLFSREFEDVINLQISTKDTAPKTGFHLRSSKKGMFHTSFKSTTLRTEYSESLELHKARSLLTVPLPPELIQRLKSAHLQDGTIRDSLGTREKVLKAVQKLIETLNRKHHCQISLKRIENHLKNYVIATERFDPVLLEPLIGKEIYYTRSPRHYAWYYNTELNQFVLQLWQQVFPMLPIQYQSELAFTGVSDDDITGFGSEFTPKLAALTNLASTLRLELSKWKSFDASSSLNSIIDYHNTYTLHTIYMLLCGTGYRAVSNPLPSFSFALMRYNAICISDKDSAITFSHMRVIACPTTLKAQLKHYQHHLDAFARLLSHNRTYESNQLRWHRSALRFIEMTSKNARLDWHFSAKNSQKNDGLFLFFELSDNGELKSINAYPKTIRRQSRQLPQLPLNCGRHYLRRYLQRNDVPQELIKLQMGHWVTGENPLEGFSSLCMTEAINDLLHILDMMMDEIGWEPIPSVLTRKRQ
ncbi:hypothetical protein [Vibrio fortis]|uniref:hypothetical protein n=1 Tax=Vibrio fortis TaxID=212667 RepID=UPI0038CD8C4A